MLMSQRGKQLDLLWERAYQGHACWRGNEKLGVVCRVQHSENQSFYAWQAGQRSGKATSLKEAKRLVEHTVALDQRQLSLF